MKKLIALLLSVVMLLTLVCGCTKQPSDPVDTPPADGADAVTTVEKLTVGLTAWPTSLDPVVYMGVKTTRILPQIFDTILYCENDGSVSSYICEEWNMVDEVTAEFKLKEGITFHNGDPLTADDIKFSVERVILDESGYSDPNIATVFGTIKAVEVVDAQTFRMVTDGPDPIFFDRLASALGVCIVPQKYLEEVGTDVFGNQPVGTGPYKVDSFSPEKIECSVYENYYGETPVAEKLTYRYFAEETSLATAIITGEVDIATDLSTTSAEILKSQSDIDCITAPYSAADMLRFNSKTGITSDKLLRQAMSLSIDRELLVETLWGGKASIPNGYNYPEFGQYYIEDYPTYQYDVEKAKELVAQSSYNGEVINFQLIPGYYAMGVEAAEAMVDMWKQVGINVQVEYVESIKTGTIVNMANWSNGLRFSDPLGGLWALWGEGTGVQKDLWEAPARFNELGNMMKSETDVEARKECYREMLQIWDDEVAGTILYCPDAVWYVREDLTWDRVPGRPINFRAELLSLK